MPKYRGETNFQPWEIPRSGLKAKDGEGRTKREKETVGICVFSLWENTRTRNGTRCFVWHPGN